MTTVASSLYLLASTATRSNRLLKANCTTPSPSGSPVSRVSARHDLHNPSTGMLGTDEVKEPAHVPSLHEGCLARRSSWLDTVQGHRHFDSPLTCWLVAVKAPFGSYALFRFSHAADDHFRSAQPGTETTDGRVIERSVDDHRRNIGNVVFNHASIDGNNGSRRITFRPKPPAGHRNNANQKQQRTQPVLPPP